jgi:hypothetical protein
VVPQETMSTLSLGVAWHGLDLMVFAVPRKTRSTCKSWCGILRFDLVINSL